MSLKIFLVYLAVISFVAFVMTVWDKHCARRGKWRVPERSLITVSLLGGSVMMLLTMKLVRHKTKHPKFMVGIPVIIVLQFAAAAIVYYYFFR